MIQFFQTIMGKTFFEGQVPALIKTLTRIAQAIEDLSTKIDENIPIPYLVEPPKAKPGTRDHVGHGDTPAYTPDSILDVWSDHAKESFHKAWREFLRHPTDEVNLRDSLQNVPTKINPHDEAPQFARLLNAIRKHCEMPGFDAVIEELGGDEEYVDGIFAGAEVMCDTMLFESEEGEDKEHHPYDQYVSYIKIAVFENKHETEVFPVAEDLSTSDVIDRLRREGKWDDSDDEEDSGSYVRLEGPFLAPSCPDFRKKLAAHIGHVSRWEVTEYGNFNDGLAYGVSLECTQCGEVLLHLHEAGEEE